MTAKLTDLGHAAQSTPTVPDVLFDHLVGAEQDRCRNIEAERLGGFQIDHEFKFCRLLDRQIGGLVALENAPDIDAGLPICLRRLSP